MIDMNLVHEVYTEDFEVKSCGRETCIKLINHLSSLYPSINFGNAETGFLYTANIVTVVNRELSTVC